ncbi:MAG: hypothetical protein ACTHMG_16600 [Sphingomonas sp.]
MDRNPDQNPGSNTSKRMLIGMAVALVLALVIVGFFLSRVKTDSGNAAAPQGPYVTNQ